MLAALLLLAASDGPTITLSVEGVPASVDLMEVIESAPAGATLVLPEGTWDDVSVTVRRPLTIRGAGPATVLSRTNDSIQDHDALRERYGDKFDRELAELQEKLDDGVDGTEWAELESAFIRKYSPRPVLEVRGGSLTLEDLTVRHPGPVNAGGFMGVPAVSARSADLTLRRVVVTGGMGVGVAASGRGELRLEECLVAGVRATGVAAHRLRDESGTDAGRRHPPAEESTRVTIERCVIRGCGYSGVTLAGDAPAVVRDCRVGPAEYHGLRNDTASPVRVERTAFERLNRAGYYADRATDADLADCRFVGCGLWLYKEADVRVVGGRFDGPAVGAGGHAVSAVGLCSGDFTGCVFDWPSPALLLQGPEPSLTFAECRATAGPAAVLRTPVEGGDPDEEPRTPEGIQVVPGVGDTATLPELPAWLFEETEGERWYAEAMAEAK